MAFDQPEWAEVIEREGLGVALHSNADEREVLAGLTAAALMRDHDAEEACQRLQQTAQVRDQVGCEALAVGPPGVTLDGETEARSEGTERTAGKRGGEVGLQQRANSDDVHAMCCYCCVTVMLQWTLPRGEC